MFLGSQETGMGWISLFNLAFLIFGVLIAWYALQVVRWEVFLKEAKGRPAAVLRLLVAILLGYQLAKFANEYMMSTMMLKQFF
ncbi:hypothetical protein CIG75_02010 [Tumebacillus algifaecis]|uniref:DUF1146 domain-containing protein n=1 Tax=Tumebacillus algifaecis TaxID=1214604 RepID=A0A223CX32_9BACL|nr:DUF1146 domain-containing protein [Tumebacillus algifaecis]ASS73866.1 hypothetical protein CIG75_02010 [Tumebacillus algifaecis]